MKTEAQAEIENAKRLVTGRIIGFIEDGQGYWGIQVKLPTGKCFDVWINCDPEGNGPGHLDIQESPK